MSVFMDEYGAECEVGEECEDAISTINLPERWRWSAIENCLADYVCVSWTACSDVIPQSTVVLTRATTPVQPR